MSTESVVCYTCICVYFVELSQGSWTYSRGSLDQKCGTFILHVYPVRKKEKLRGHDGDICVPNSISVAMTGNGDTALSKVQTLSA